MDDKLLKEIEKFVITKIKLIQCVDEIFLNQDFSISMKMCTFNNDCYSRYLLSKKIFQIIINIHNNFEIYKDCLVQFTDEPKEDLDPLKNCFSFDDSDRVWRCFGRPKESDIVTAFYNYVVCRTSLSFKDEIVAKDMDVKVCPFCDIDVSPGADKCDICESSVEEMIARLGTMNKRDTGNASKGTEVKNDGNKTYANIYNQENEDWKASESHKWKCARCECLNEYVSGNCRDCECDRDFQRWVCRSCSRENDRDDNVCTECLSINDGLSQKKVNIEGECVETPEGRGIKYEDDKWKCLKCGFSNERGEEKCKLCQYSSNEGMEEEREYSGEPPASQMRYGEDKWRCSKCEFLNEHGHVNCSACQDPFSDGMWMCTGCSLENRCVNAECVGCGKSNERIRRGMATIQEGWTCEKCGQMRLKLESTCMKCLSDGFKFEDGRNGWKCEKCGRLADFADIVCGACSCSRLAHGLWKCDKCSFVNRCAQGQCLTCGGANERLIIHCRHCWRNVVIGEGSLCHCCKSSPGNIWKCSYEHCGESTNINEEFCRLCLQWRYNQYLPGKAVRLLYNGRDLYVIRCRHCDLVWDISLQICPRCHWHLWETRLIPL